MRTKWIANCSWMVCESTARMCGWDCEPALCCLRTVCIPFATNWNLLVFCANTKGIGCAGCPVFASGSQKINLPHAQCELFMNHLVCTWFVCVYRLLSYELFFNFLKCDLFNISNNFQARRQLSAAGYLSDQESIHSVSLGNRPSNGRITPSTGNAMANVGDRGSCSADSGVRGSSDRESGATSAGGNLSDSTADGTLYGWVSDI